MFYTCAVSEEPRDPAISRRTLRRSQPRSFSQGTPLSWKQLEGVLSGVGPGLRNLRAIGVAEGDRKTGIEVAETEGASQRKTATPFAELHACSAYNFLRGASQAELGMDRAIAYAYLSAAADFTISQVVDRTVGVHGIIAKSHFA